MSSTSTITIPAKLLPLLRSGAQIQAGRAAEAFSQASEWLGRERRSDWFLEPRHLMDSYTALLDAIGWSECQPEQNMKLDRDYHRFALATALEGQHEVERYQLHDGHRAGRRAARQNLRAIRRFLAANHDLAQTGLPCETLGHLRRRAREAFYKLTVR